MTAPTDTPAKAPPRQKMPLSYAITAGLIPGMTVKLISHPRLPKRLTPQIGRIGKLVEIKSDRAAAILLDGDDKAIVLTADCFLVIHPEPLQPAPSQADSAAEQPEASQDAANAANAAQVPEATETTEMSQISSQTEETAAMKTETKLSEKEQSLLAAVARYPGFTEVAIARKLDQPLIDVRRTANLLIGKEILAESGTGWKLTQQGRQASAGMAGAPDQAETSETEAETSTPELTITADQVLSAIAKLSKGGKKPVNDLDIADKLRVKMREVEVMCEKLHASGQIAGNGDSGWQLVEKEETAANSAASKAETLETVPETSTADVVPAAASQTKEFAIGDRVCLQDKPTEAGTVIGLNPLQVQYDDLERPLSYYEGFVPQGLTKLEAETSATSVVPAAEAQNAATEAAEEAEDESEADPELIRHNSLTLDYAVGDRVQHLKKQGRVTLVQHFWLKIQWFGDRLAKKYNRGDISFHGITKVAAADAELQQTAAIPAVPPIPALTAEAEEELLLAIKARPSVDAPRLAMLLGWTEEVTTKAIAALIAESKIAPQPHGSSGYEVTEAGRDRLQQLEATADDEGDLDGALDWEAEEAGSSSTAGKSSATSRRETAATEAETPAAPTDAAAGKEAGTQAAEAVQTVEAAAVTAEAVPAAAEKQWQVGERCWMGSEANQGTVVGISPFRVEFDAAKGKVSEFEDSRFLYPVPAPSEALTKPNQSTSTAADNAMLETATAAPSTASQQPAAAPTETQPTEPALNQTERCILAIIQSKPNAKDKAIAKEIQLNLAEAANLTQDLAKRDLIFAAKLGGWKITEKGKAALAAANGAPAEAKAKPAGFAPAGSGKAAEAKSEPEAAAPSFDYSQLGATTSALGIGIVADLAVERREEFERRLKMGERIDAYYRQVEGDAGKKSKKTFTEWVKLEVPEACRTQVTSDRALYIWYSDLGEGTQAKLKANIHRISDTVLAAMMRVPKPLLGLVSKLIDIAATTATAIKQFLAAFGIGGKVAVQQVGVCEVVDEVDEFGKVLVKLPTGAQLSYWAEDLDPIEAAPAEAKETKAKVNEELQLANNRIAQLEQELEAAKADAARIVQVEAQIKEQAEQTRSEQAAYQQQLTGKVMGMIAKLASLLGWKGNASNLEELEGFIDGLAIPQGATQAAA